MKIELQMLALVAAVLEPNVVVDACGAVAKSVGDGRAVWHLYDPERFGSISGIDVLQ